MRKITKIIVNNLSITINVLLIILLLATYAYGLFTKTVPNTANIIPQTPSPNIVVEVYSDAGATQPITNLAWGNVTKGTSSSQTFYVKNLSNVPVSLSSTNNLPSTVGTNVITFSKTTLAIDEVTGVQSVFNVSASASAGNTSWDVIINAE